MPSATVVTVVGAPSAAIFELVHDYSQRLAWDSLLREAYLLDGASCAALGGKSRCVARWALGGGAMDTRYIAFQPPRLAAVTMTRGPLYFRSFSASLRHEVIDENTTEVTYRYHFETWPGSLSWLLDRIVGRALQRETQRRLLALKQFFKREKRRADDST